MRRSFLLSRRIHSRHRYHTHTRRHTRRHPQYHHSHKHKRHHTRRTLHRRKKRSHGGNSFIGTWNGEPFTKNTIVTNSKGNTRPINQITSPLSNSETDKHAGDLDI